MGQLQIQQLLVHKDQIQFFQQLLLQVVVVELNQLVQAVLVVQAAEAEAVVLTQAAQAILPQLQ